MGCVQIAWWNISKCTCSMKQYATRVLHDDQSDQAVENENNNISHSTCAKALEMACFEICNAIVTVAPSRSCVNNLTVYIGAFIFPIYVRGLSHQTLLLPFTRTSRAEPHRTLIILWNPLSRSWVRLRSLTFLFFDFFFFSQPMCTNKHVLRH